MTLKEHYENYKKGIKEQTTHLPPPVICEILCEIMEKLGWQKNESEADREKWICVAEEVKNRINKNRKNANEMMGCFMVIGIQQNKL